MCKQNLTQIIYYGMTFAVFNLTKIQFINCHARKTRQVTNKYK